MRQLKFKKIFKHPIILTIIFLAFLVLVAIPTFKNIKKQIIVKQEIEDLKREIKEKENKNEEIENLIGYLNSDQFVEEQARLNLGLKKPGEAVVVVKEDVLKQYSLLGQEEEGDSQENNLSNPKKWWNYFFN